MSDKIEEIRARHLRDDRWRYSPSMMAPQMHDDRATLLDEVDRRGAEIERLREALTSIARNTCCDRCQEAALVARNALEGKP